MSSHRLMALATTLVVCLVCSCGSHDPIAGTWQRTDDEFAGAVVNVEKIRGEYYGKLLQVPDTMRHWGFVVGDVKWRDIVPVTKRDRNRRYMGKDLFKFVSDGQIVETRYNDAMMELTSKDALRLRLLAKGEEVIGTEQHWRKTR